MKRLITMMQLRSHTMVRVLSRVYHSWSTGSVWYRLIVMIAAMVLILLYGGFVRYSTMQIMQQVTQHVRDSQPSGKRQRVLKMAPKPRRHTNESASAKIAPKELWKHPTGGAYPDMSKVNKTSLKVKVDLSRQRVHIYSAKKLLYTMIVSAGMDNSTPKGDFVIRQRGEHFFNANEQMGGDYWVGFSGAVYLFHSVPTHVNQGDYIVSEAQKLGSPASHGCVRMSVPDAQWFYQYIPDGTAVHIE